MIDKKMIIKLMQDDVKGIRRQIEKIDQLFDVLIQIDKAGNGMDVKAELIGISQYLGLKKKFIMNVQDLEESILQS